MTRKGHRPLLLDPDGFPVYRVRSFEGNAYGRPTICVLSGDPLDEHTHRVPPGRMTEAEFAAYDRAWCLQNGINPGTEATVEDDREDGGARESTPESRERKRRMVEALAYVASYTGTWGLVLDVRADRRWGTKYMRLSERQVDVLLAGKARDAERAAAQAAVQADPRQAAARTFVQSVAHVRPGFEEDMRAMAVAGRPYSPGQLGAIEGWKGREDARSTAQAPAGVAAQPAPGAPMGGGVTEGMYRDPDGVVWKVQRAVHGSGQLYAKRLDITGDSGSFAFVPGGIRQLRPEWRMTLEDAEAFGKLYGFCVVCGATLTDERSIAAGIGPVCARRGSW